MLNTIYRLALAAGLLMSTFSLELNAETLRVATYNVWNPLFEERYSGQNTWKERLPYITHNIMTSDSDLLCLQEVSKEAFDDIVEDLGIESRYLSLYLPHGVSSPEHKEGRDGLALFYRPEKASLLRLVSSSDGARPTHRRDFYADLQVNRAEGYPVVVRIACTHLDSGKDLDVGNGQLAALVDDALGDGTGTPDFVVICGDFNEGEDEALRPRYDTMIAAGFISDGSVATTRPEALDVRHKGHVDWIYFKALSSLSYQMLPLAPIGDEKASDHKLTMTDVVW